MLFNKHVAGRRYRCRALNVSAHGLRAQSLNGPSLDGGVFCLELKLPGDDRSLWIWARSVWKRDCELASEFVSMHERDRRRLDRYLDRLAW